MLCQNVDGVWSERLNDSLVCVEHAVSEFNLQEKKGINCFSFCPAITSCFCMCIGFCVLRFYTIISLLPFILTPRGDVLVTIPASHFPTVYNFPVFLSGFVPSSVNITEFCLPINPAPNECILATANPK